MASLGRVTPEAATEGVTPLIFPEKPGNLFFADRSHYRYRFLLLSLGCHPPPGCHPTPFLPVRPCFSTILCKFAHKIFFPFGVNPWRVSPGAVCPPPSDATGTQQTQLIMYHDDHQPLHKSINQQNSRPNGLFEVLCAGGHR